MRYSNLRRPYMAILMIAVVIVIGVIGFMALESYNFTQAFFMTVITIATVGFGTVRPLTDGGMWFTSFLIFVSFGIFAYAVSSLTAYFADGTFRNYYKDKKMLNKINKLQDHVIICGFGRNGMQAAQELIAHKVPFVIIENNESLIEDLRNSGEILFVDGDATQDEVLLQAGLEQARAIIATLPNDAHNLFLTLTARQLNPKITIISRAADDTSDIKLRRAGANNVIMPDKIGGRRMARLVAQPDVVEFVEYMMLQGDYNVVIDEVDCSCITDYFNGRPMRELEKFNESGARIIGIKLHDQSYLINPLLETIISSHDKLFVLGTKRQIKRFQEILSDSTIKG